MTYDFPLIFSVLTSVELYKKSPCITPFIPKSGRYCKANLNFLLRSPEVSASISSSLLYTLGDLLKIPFFATKNLLSRGSIPAKIAGAPSHLTLTFPSCSPPSVSLKDRRASIASLVPLTPP